MHGTMNIKKNEPLTSKDEGTVIVVYGHNILWAQGC